jgi:hypothetical protein
LVSISGGHQRDLMEPARPNGQSPTFLYSCRYLPSALNSKRCRFSRNRIPPSPPYFPTLYFQRVTTNTYIWCLRYPLGHPFVVCARGSGTPACFHNTAVPCGRLLQLSIELLCRKRSNFCRQEKRICLVGRGTTAKLKAWILALRNGSKCRRDNPKSGRPPTGAIPGNVCRRVSS